MVGGAGSLDAMEHHQGRRPAVEGHGDLQPDDGVVGDLAGPPGGAGRKGMEDLVELQVPKLIILQSETITKDNVDQYMPLGFRS